ncbi:hypothetical protein QTP86_000477 [Hemibagrus guttatus]|nr:hypothetical protein QTP86_000477 [Hemibagrus guttatus]
MIKEDKYRQKLHLVHRQHSLQCSNFLLKGRRMVKRRISLLSSFGIKGCELSSSQTTVVFEAEDDLLENQFFIKTICLSAQASDELHVVAVSDGVGESKPVPIATLRHCMPTVSFPALELMPPVTFNLCSGKGPVFIFAQHITLNPTENTEEEEEDGGGSFLVDDLTD